ncbi:putative alpha-soluble NSF attachment protein [Apostichopus japonicus]|uniref:Putative alpha-soluble NSF attachment protein n=1 Tax=Stichopus japonicus TaxID=307972 RepID=A0A2G8L7S9_STIJA|nr:putative alpha-soluble NSF attachment protein [Apostichopus japonicus]
MADSEKKGQQLMAEAEKKLKSSQSFLGSMFGGAQKQEEACELYERAANQFKMAKKWNGKIQIDYAGNTLLNCYICVSRECILSVCLHTPDTAGQTPGSYNMDAATSYRKDDQEKAISCLQRAIEIYIDMGKFTQAAKHHMSIAEIYETNLVDLDKAVEHYEKAADYYKGEESNRYSAAVTIAAICFRFQAALCHMCVDNQNAQIAISKYEDKFPAFSDSREYKLLQKLVAAGEEQNADDFTDAVKQYDSISRLDNWYTTILLRIKKTIAGDSDLK